MPPSAFFVLSSSRHQECAGSRQEASKAVISSLGSPLKSQNVGHVLCSSLPSGGRGSQAILASVSGIASPLEQQQAIQLSCVQWPTGISNVLGFPLGLWDPWGWRQLLGCRFSPRNRNIRNIVQSYLSLFKEKLGVYSQSCGTVLGERLRQEHATDFPTSFNAALQWDAGASELVSRFPTKQINSCVPEFVSPWGEKGFGASNSAILLISLSYFFSFTGSFL